MQNKFRVIVLTTGGTIDKTYDESAGSLENRGTVMKEKVFAKLRLPHTDVDIHPLMSKDSLVMTDQDRELICRSISKFSEQNHPIIVIHGTDTMTVTAQFCQRKLPSISVPVIFTGAMKPQGYEDSDALQNVAETLMAARILSAGFYISFHNCIFEAQKARKNRETMTFDF